MFNKQMKKVSLIIPYYNSAGFIRECLSSIFSQSYSNLEIIIINDGSDPEETAYIESLLSDDRIEYLKNEERQGVAFSRNKGLKSATGEYIFFLDSDDLISPYAIEVLVDNIQDYPAIFGTRKKLLRSSDFEPFSDLPDLKVKKVSVKKLFKGRSILNVLIDKEFLQQVNFKFYEGTEGYSDISGIIPFILSTDKLPQLNIKTYYKRVGVDPITKPSLIQRPIEERAREFIKMYLDMKIEYKESEEVLEYLDKLFLSYYRSSVIYIFRDYSYFDEFFNLLGTAIETFDVSLLSSQPSHIRKEFKYLKKRYKNKFHKALRFHIDFRELRNALKKSTRLKRYIFKKAFEFISKLPTNQKLIMFESFAGKQFSDNPRAIYQYLKDHNPEFKMYWSIDPRFRKEFSNQSVPIVERFSLKWLLLMARARFWVTNSRMPMWIPKPKNTIYLQTWHGTPLKRLAQDMKEVLMPGTTSEKYKKNFFKESRNWDYLVSPNRYSTEIFKRAFQFDKEIIESGYPRNDVFYSPKREKDIKAFKIKYGLSEDKKIILYAPTWRDNQYHKVGKYKMDLQLDLEKLRNELGDEYIIILRMHYLVAENFDLSVFKGFAFDFSKHDDIQDLCL
ncbi:bifunctional glycosyltransferase/CDP-glycerol:glycerophosphate glycerophosphotransferase, partial [Neobacillus drentensis]|uniref:bifunctional glycosyltransferase/CDP-glycerol:glycerophosphate glycerophosphotransferase n=1 Tax=Neobacillus drentensis TaxID=220684 RepID=UPI002FFEC2CD